MSVKPTKPKTPSHDNVVRVTCPYCSKSHLVSVVTESWPDFERDELGMPILDEEGKPKLKMRIAPEYIAVPRVIQYQDSQQELLEPLLQRRDKDMKLHEQAKEQLETLREGKKREKKTPLEITA